MSTTFVRAQSFACDEKRQLRIENITSSTFILTWKSKHFCTDDDIRLLEPFEVEVKHKGYRACEFTKNSSAISDTANNDSFKITLDESMYQQKYIIFGDKKELHPFSKYEVEIRSITTRFTKIFEVATKAGYPDNVPRMSTTNKNSATSTSIQFVWEASDEKHCKLQNGIFEDYRVELWGLDKWVKPIKTNVINGDHYLETKNVEVGFYYAPNLKPFSRYQLRVFNRNIKEDNPSSVDTPELYNHAKYLKINIQTLPSEPKPPIELQGTSLDAGNKGNSFSSVHLRWVPSYPPTGMIEKYRLRQGELNDTGSLVFKELRDFYPANERSLCPSSSDDMNISFHDPYCCVIGDLESDTTYFFGVQVFNLDVNKGSEFSETFNVTTEPIINVVTTTTKNDAVADHTEKQINTIGPPTTKFSVTTPETSASNGTIIVILLSIGVLVLLVICFVLRRKIRRTTEKIILRSGGNESNVFQTSLNALNSTDMYNSQFDNGIPTISSPNEVTRHTGVTHSYTGRPASPSFESHVIRSVVNQIEEIQSRKLPDVPPTEQSVISTSNTNEVLWGLELQKFEDQESNKNRKLPLPPVRSMNYCDPEDSIRFDSVSTGNFHLNQRNEPPDLIPQKNEIPILKSAENVIGKQDMPPISIKTVNEECTDTYGYLQPTFLRPNSIQDPPESTDVDKLPIPKESYTQITTDLHHNPLEFGVLSSTNDIKDSRPNSNNSDLSFSNLRAYNTSQKSQSTKSEFEDRPLISQTTMNV